MDYSRFIDFVKTLNLSDQDKTALLNQINDPDLTDEQKTSAMMMFIRTKEQELDGQIEAITNKIKQDSQALTDQMDEADAKFKAGMDALNVEAETALTNLENQIDSV